WRAGSRRECNRLCDAPQPFTRCCKPDLRCGWQRDRNPRAQGRFQRTLTACAETHQSVRLLSTFLTVSALFYTFWIFTVVADFLKLNGVKHKQHLAPGGMFDAD